MSQWPDLGTRPYRSHKVRACDLCRRRKSRCTLDIPGKACVMCRVAGIDCYYSKNEPVTVINNRHRARLAEPEQSSRQEIGLDFSPRHEYRETEAVLETLIDGESELSHIISPIMADDAKVLQQHFSPDNSTQHESGYYRVCSNDTGKPIIYSKELRRPPGLQSSAAAGAQQRVIMEQILGQFKEELVNTYFDKIHPSFPILDRASLQDVKRQHTAMCEIYAISVLYWNSSDILSSRPRPDTKYFWNLAVSALHEEFLNPGLSTIPSALIDLTGRPSLWATGNVLNSGRTVALAHSLGLNRNPRRWKIHKTEQDHRIRLWWGVVIHDRWASFAHGVPPSIVRATYDVLLPSIDDMIPACASSNSQLRSIEIFISLCSLSEILGDILPLIYDLDMSTHKNLAKKMRRLDVDLDNWEDGLPEWLQSSHGKPLSPVVSGSSNLQLSLLAVRLLLHRIRLHEATACGAKEQIHYHRSGCREGALGIVDFTLALESTHRQEFWLPYSAYHLSSTATVLLRCAIEAEDKLAKETCLSNVKRLIDYLEKAREEDEWDIGNVCLAHCKAAISRMTVSHSVVMENVALAAEHRGSQEFNSVNGDNLTGISGFDDAILDGFELDMGDVWDDFCSTLEYI